MLIYLTDMKGAPVKIVKYINKKKAHSRNIVGLRKQEINNINEDVLLLPSRCNEGTEE